MPLECVYAVSAQNSSQIMLCNNECSVVPVDMLSAGVSASGGCGGGGRLGRCRGGLGVGLFLGSVPLSGGGEVRAGGVCACVCPGDVSTQL